MSIALHYLSKTDIQVLYHIQNSVFNYGYIRITYNNPTSINIKEVAKTHHIYAIANIPLTPNETVNMKLMVIRNGPTKYTMQYHDVIRGVVIRSDNFHGYRHIDIELPQERLPPIPISELTDDVDLQKSYEFVINYILQIAERHTNPLAGVIHWLSPALILPLDLLSLFNTLRSKYEPQMSLTVIARAIHMDIINEVKNGKKLRSKDYAKIIKDRFEWISKEEKENASLPRLQPIGTQHFSSIAALPFPVSTPPGAFLSVKGYDETTGSMQDVDPAAFVIEAKDAAFVITILLINNRQITFHRNACIVIYRIKKIKCRLSTPLQKFPFAVQQCGDGITNFFIISILYISSVGDFA